jgi:hypothetical protein
MNNPKILLAAPTSKHKDYCFQEWAKHVKSLTYDIDVIIIDNTKDGGKYRDNVISKQFPSAHVEPMEGEDSYNLICRCQNMIRAYMLNKGYDYLFMLESDQFPPLNVVEYLLKFDVQVSSLPYFIGTAFGSKLLQNEMEEFGVYRSAIIPPQEKIFFDWTGEFKTKFNHGIGCMLIKRSIMERLKFRVDPTNDIEAHSDVYFHDDLRRMGVSSFISERYFCHHENASWFNILKKTT